MLGLKRSTKKTHKTKNSNYLCVCVCECAGWVDYTMPLIYIYIHITVMRFDGKSNVTQKT